MITNVLLYITLLTIISAFLITFYQISIKMFTGSTNIYQYKISSFYKSWSIAISYVFIFIIIMYGLRLYSLPRSIDIKSFISILFRYSDLFLSNKIAGILLLCIVILLLLFSLLILIGLYKYLTHHVHMLFLYYTHPRVYVRDNNPAKIILFDRLCLISDDDLISFYVRDIIGDITRFIDDGFTRSYHTFPWYRLDRHMEELIITITYNKYYKKAVIISPLFVIIYDCIFNDLIITHIFYYLLLYVPLMLIKKITTKLSLEATFFCDLLWDIYYKKERCIYAISVEDKKLMDIYLLSGLNFDIDLGMEIEFYLQNVTRFELDYENNYVNSMGIRLKLDNNGTRAFALDNNDNISSTEYLILANKTSIDFT